MNDTSELLIIADNLVNDYCSRYDRYKKNNVHIGDASVKRLFGDKGASSALVSFLRKASECDRCHVLFVRDLYDSENMLDLEHLERLGNHCIAGSSGEDFVGDVEDLVKTGTVVNCSGLQFPTEEFERFISDRTGYDSMSAASVKMRVLLVGFHTERRVFSMASTLKNVYKFTDVAVFTHFVASSNVEAHYSSLRYMFPDNLVDVISDPERLAEYVGFESTFLERFGFNAVQITPTDIRAQLTDSQKDIVQSICMHWTEANLKPLGGGFSGSALFIARGKQGNSLTEPMVIKIDSHDPIRMEIKGYNRVKDLMGKHVPTFTLPVSVGAYSGIGMELAAMEGAPRTLQDHLERASNDYELDAFMELLDTTLKILSKRVYQNTLTTGHVAPYRHFLLHISQQPIWLKHNIDNIERHESKDMFISGDVVVNLFNIVRKNSDVLNSQLCVAHGDLNLANAIVDDKQNVWAIDWTHTQLHPVAVDFAKLENDLKFVLSKELGMTDLPQVQQMEEFLLSALVPPPIDDIPEELYFLRWDIRFKKIYLPVRELRLTYHRLHQSQDWLVYKVALLRYALHTMSFDKTLGNGECNPCQLWHALFSVENLLYQLVGDDYHLKIRSEKPDDYPERQRINIDLANWKVDCPGYAPPYYVADSVIESGYSSHTQGKVDPEDNWHFADITDWGREFKRDEQGRPLNPSGRTGVAGRGSLWLWGSNPMVFLCPVRLNDVIGKLEILVLNEGETTDIICGHLKRGESVDDALKQVFDRVGLSSSTGKEEIFSGYLYDPRQTDNAWVDAKAYLMFFNENDVEVNSDHVYWRMLDDIFINNLHPSYSGFVRKAIQDLYDNEVLTDQFVIDILEKTG